MKRAAKKVKKSARRLLTKYEEVFGLGGTGLTFTQHHFKRRALS